MIFISYNHNDEQLVDMIARRLELEFGRDNIFYDKWSMQPGDSIIGKMNEGLEQFTTFFYFLSPNSLTSKMVAKEWQSALNKAVNENFVRSRQGAKSRKEIRAALLQKGVSPELIDQAFEICGDEGGEESAIRSILRKKKFDPETAEEKEKQKIYGYLARKGFRYETVRQVIQNYSDDA